MRLLQQLIPGAILLAACACSSTESGSKQPPNIDVVNSDTLLRKTDDGWLYKGKPFSGYMVEKETNDRVVYKLPIIGGRENGLAKGWYNTGEKLLERWFVDGRKEGTFRQWWPNGRLRYVFQYKDNQYNGLQLVYFPKGTRREESTYIAGEQAGSQRIWNEKGQLVSNYIIKNKRTYGLVSVKSCIPVEHL